MKCLILVKTVHKHDKTFTVSLIGKTVYFSFFDLFQQYLQFNICEITLRFFNKYKILYCTDCEIDNIAV